jgi:hypothetical protein
MTHALTSLCILTSPTQIPLIDSLANARDSDTDSKSHHPDYSNWVSILRYNLCKFCELDWLDSKHGCPRAPDLSLLLILVHFFSTKLRKRPSINFTIFVLVFAVFMLACGAPVQSRGIHWVSNPSKGCPPRERYVQNQQPWVSGVQYVTIC